MKKILAGAAGSLLFMPVLASAHVGYVVNESEALNNSGKDWDFLLGPVKDPFYFSLMALVLVLAALVYLWLDRNNFFQKHVGLVKQRVESYQEFIAWIMRLGLGIALIGAGTAGVLISPNLPNQAAFSGIQILLGFFILAGFLLGPSVLVVLALYAIALFKNFQMLGNLDIAALAIGLLAVANPKPGIDDLLGIKLISPLKFLKTYVPLILRIGIGGAMMFLAVYEKMLNPHLSALVVQNYHLNSVIPVSEAMWVLAAGAIEFLVGFLLLIGHQTRLVVVVAFLVLSLSFFYFHEAVYSHVSLFATLSILFITGKGHIKKD